MLPRYCHFKVYFRENMCDVKQDKELITNRKLSLYPSWRFTTFLKIIQIVIQEPYNFPQKMFLYLHFQK